MKTDESGATAPAVTSSVRGVEHPVVEDGAECRWPEKIQYLSETVAKNAAILHTMASLDQRCTAIEAYPCGDHFHIGHSSHTDAKKCKRELRTVIDWRRGQISAGLRVRDAVEEEGVVPGAEAVDEA